ncbi:ribosome-binding protein 1-like [Acanthaster planci]|uniref:Ribosome-binding protein 1-like n=1 Tax=Acanthaster planci TaxID=133434 RepID=A0A8B7ZJI4_ACAPL|nr:ribosome-binding protein 1-like [Acanthaster planci]
MASRHQITRLVLAVLLIAGFVYAQDQESQEDGEGVQLGLADILRPKQQRKPVAQVGEGEAESEQQEAGAQVGGGGGDAESNELGGNAEQNEADAEAAEDAAEAAAEAEEAAREAAEEGSEGAGEAGEGSEGAGEAGEGSEGAGEAGEGSEGAGEAGEGSEGAGEAGEGSEGAGEAGEGGETGGAEVPPGAPVVGAGKGEKTQMDTDGSSPFFNIGGGQQDGQEQIGGAQMGGDNGESGEEAQAGAMGAAQAAGGGGESEEETQPGAIGANTESGEQAGVLGQQADAESAEETTSQNSVRPLVSTSDTDADIGEGSLSISMSIGSEGGVPASLGSDIEIDNDASNFQKPNLPVGSLADKAKQVSGTGTTMKIEPTPPITKAPEGKPEEEKGLSDSYKKRIAISGAAVGAVVLVGIFAYVVGKRVTRRSYTN